MNETNFEITNPTGFLNGDAFKISDFKGKVVLLSIWTLGCGNCTRTLPFLNEIYDKYVGHDFEIVSIHSPEFDYEKEIEEVKSSIERHGIKYRVALDNALENFHKNDNVYWPRKYLLNRDGKIVDTWVGEGHYKEIEASIINLLGK